VPMIEKNFSQHHVLSLIINRCSKFIKICMIYTLGHFSLHQNLDKLDNVPRVAADDVKKLCEYNL
jgi:hypothetical protein